jgi:hypothetical protein
MSEVGNFGIFGLEQGLEVLIGLLKLGGQKKVFLLEKAVLLCQRMPQ